MGQPEAVTCLVDRVAMLKAGLTDPDRPIGVFLFAGPTGTGKTEVAKTLAEFLFGSQDRMIRLDMSEFQEPSSVARIVGERRRGARGRLADQPHPQAAVLGGAAGRVREGASARVGPVPAGVRRRRLTDAHGNLADFRYSIIVLTSNLGATQHRAASLGFNPAGGEFSEQQILRVIGETFRPEFVNRLDRVVVFRPLSRMVMREILKKELRNVLQRRGFRNREWAVEWEESALEFLLDKGFTPDMGARPLRRAIEQHLLAPDRDDHRRAPLPGRRSVPVRAQRRRCRPGGVRRSRRGVGRCAGIGSRRPWTSRCRPWCWPRTGRDVERRFLEQRLADARRPARRRSSGSSASSSG